MLSDQVQSTRGLQIYEYMFTCVHHRPVNQDLVAMYGAAQGLNSLAGALGRRAIEL